MQVIATKWYSEGVEVVFSVGGANYEPIFKAAENTSHAVIGVEKDQSYDSPAVITSAMMLLDKPVYDSIANFYNNSFPGGKTLIYSAENSGVGLPMETSRFKTFNSAQYNAIYAKLHDGTIVVDNGFIMTADQVKTSIVNVTVWG